MNTEPLNRGRLLSFTLVLGAGLTLIVLWVLAGAHPAVVLAESG